MSQHDLSVRTREVTGKEVAGRLRREGYVPAVAYGHKEAPVTLSVNSKELRDLVTHGHTHGLINLKFEGGSSPDASVIIKAMQKHPLTHAVTAVDFLRVSMDERVKATVPIHLEGEPAGVKLDGGVLVQALHEIQIEALPQDLPEHITVDVSNLEFNGAPIHVKEVTLPAGVKAITDGDESIAVVNPPDVEPEAEAPTTEEAENVEAIEGGRTDSGDGTGEGHGERSSDS